MNDYEQDERICMACSVAGCNCDSKVITGCEDDRNVKMTMIIKYTSSVKTPAGWRSELITARAEAITDKRLRVVEVIDIGGNGCTGYASRTGAKRQQYNVAYFAKQQIGLVKLVNFVKVEALA